MRVYFNAISIFRGLELWRLITNFFFFGSINIDFLFHMFFLTRYAKMLEEGTPSSPSFPSLLLFPPHAL
jgi:Derlin-2/3